MLLLRRWTVLATLFLILVSFHLFTWTVFWHSSNNNNNNNNNLYLAFVEESHLHRSPYYTRHGISTQVVSSSLNSTTTIRIGGDDSKQTVQPVIASTVMPLQGTKLQQQQKSQQPPTTTTSSSNNNNNNTIKQRTKRHDRMETLERLKHVLEINSTVELLQTILGSGGDRRHSRDDNNNNNNNIPLWSDIERLYGTKFPNILGLEHCSHYRNTVPKSQQWIAPAGLFHTGTNLLASLMTSSCRVGSSNSSSVSSSSFFRGQVPYGKHNPLQAAIQADYRVVSTTTTTITTTNLSHVVLPVVMVRHPLDWMQSMCRQKYALSWHPNDDNKKNNNHNTTNTTNTNTTTNITNHHHPCPYDTPVSVSFFQTKRYRHILDMWYSWNLEYFQYGQNNNDNNDNNNNHPSHPRLMVRLEDLVYAPRETLQQLCDCVVGDDDSNNNSTFHYQPQFLQQRRGGRVVVTNNNDDDKANNHALVEAWTRHARATIEHIVPPEQQTMQKSSFRDLWAQEQARMQPLLEALHYAIV
jgi:hypothetical protein